MRSDLVDFREALHIEARKGRSHLSWWLRAKNVLRAYAVPPRRGRPRHPFPRRGALLIALRIFRGRWDCLNRGVNWDRCGLMLGVTELPPLRGWVTASLNTRGRHP